jgi:carboxypeptidase PM20D1
MLKRIFWAVLVLLLVLVGAVAANTLAKGSRQLEVPPLPPLVVDKDAAASHLAEAVRARTVTAYGQPDLNADQFAQLHAMLQARYPKLHAALKREVVGGNSLLYTWQGSDPKAQPILLTAHQDVVPVAAGTEKDWAVDAFSGTLKDGFVWGRGAWDDKGNLISQLEAVEMLVANGYQPQRTVYLAYGADEELGGQRGAAAITALLKSRGVHLSWVIDEGLLITEGIMPGLDKPTALIGVAEKGYLSLVLRIPATPGHSSMPPPQGKSAIAQMSAVLKYIEEHQLPAAISGVAGEMFDTIVPEMHGFSRVALSNLWLFGPLVQKQLEGGASTNAMLRTTTALTVVHAGNKDNVLPGLAEATINFRLLPGDTTQGVTERVRQQVKDVLGADAKFELAPLAEGSEPSKVSATATPQYQLINRTVREVFPGTVVTPGLMIGATDSVHYSQIADNTFRFSPVRAKSEDLPRFHGTNERISADNLAELIRFYHRLITQGAKAS